MITVYARVYVDVMYSETPEIFGMVFKPFQKIFYLCIVQPISENTGF